MRRRYPILMSAATVVSLVLCGLIVVLWVRSPSRGGLLLGRASVQVAGGVVTQRDTGFFSSGRGELGFVSNVYQEPAGRMNPITRAVPRTSDRRGLVDRPDLLVGPYRDGDDLLVELGFGLGRVEYPWAPAFRDTRTFVMIPHWFALVVTGVLPLCRFVRWVGWWPAFGRSATVGICTTCGYDLRATPERCPECGHVAEGVRA